MDSETIIIFLHMFKAGGTTVTSKIADNFGPEHHAIFNTNPNHPRHPLVMKDPLLVTGHFLFGVHRYLNKPCKYITFLRDPVDRIVSAYFNIREPKCSGHSLHKLCTSVGLEEFVKQYRPETQIQVDNYQVRELVGLAGEESSSFEITEVDF